MKLYFSPFLIIGWIAIIIQIIFAMNHNQTGNLICMGIAIGCFIAGMIHTTTIHSEKIRKERINTLMKTMNELEKKTNITKIEES